MSRTESVPFKIMLVEDDDGFRRSLAGLITARFPFIGIVEAANGTEAMEKVESFLPQLIFMDIKLPDQSGMEITRRVKALHPDMLVIMLTSYDFPEYREAAQKSGANGFLSKASSTAEEIEGLVGEIWGKFVSEAA